MELISRFLVFVIPSPWNGFVLLHNYIPRNSYASLKTQYDRNLTHKSYIAIATLLIEFIQGVKVSMNNPREQSILSFMLVFIMLAGIFHFQICCKRAAEIVELVNAFIKFEKMYTKGVKNLLTYQCY